MSKFKYASMIFFAAVTFIASTALQGDNPVETGDSTEVRPAVDPKTVELAYPGEKPVVKPIANEAYPQACPPKITNCPTINDFQKNPNINPATCPSMCSVSQSGNALSMQDAVCPDGYTQVAEYKAGPEYAWSTNPYFPKNMAEYTQYANMGFNCHPGSGSYTWSSSSCTKSGPTWGNGTYTDSMPNTTGVVYMYHYYQHCWTGGSNCGAHAICGTAGERYTYDYDYKYVQCDPPAGGANLPTGNLIPTSVVCARDTPVWEYQTDPAANQTP